MNEEFMKNIGFSPVSEEELRRMNSLKLAYLGDAVLELYIRYFFLGCGTGKNKELFARSSGMANAQFQSEFIRQYLPQLSEEEEQVFKRGRNATLRSRTKSCNFIEYRYATGYEALIGWLYLKQDRKRLESIIAESLAYKRRKEKEAFGE